MEDKKPEAIHNCPVVEDAINSCYETFEDNRTTDNETEKLLLPNYTCNIYENLMVFKMDVKNVDPDSVIKQALNLNDGLEQGFSLSFVNIGAGMVPLKYGFKMVFVSEQVEDDVLKEDNTSILEKMEVEVWDNNIIVQMALPKNAQCKSYKVGSCIADMKEHPLNHPLRAFKKKLSQLKVSYFAFL